MRLTDTALRTARRMTRRARQAVDNVTGDRSLEIRDRFDPAHCRPKRPATRTRARAR